MSKGHVFRVVAFAAVLICVGARPALGDTSVTVDGVNLTLNTTALTVTEGNSITLDFTATNGSGFAITGAAVSFSGLGLVTGDTSDAYNGILPVIESPCVELAPNPTCDLQVTLTTLPGSGETDGDFGVNEFDISWEFFGLPACPNTLSPGCVLNFTTDITVQDVPGATTPEPSSLLLLGSGLVGVGSWVRRRVVRA